MSKAQIIRDRLKVIDKLRSQRDEAQKKVTAIQKQIDEIYTERCFQEMIVGTEAWHEAQLNES